MSGYPIHTPETAPAESRAPLERLRDVVGFVPNAAATMAESPALITSFEAARGALAAGGLSELERQAAALAVAFEYGCNYCMAFHSTVALNVGATDDDLSMLRAGHPPQNSRLAVVAETARALVREKGRLSDDDVEAFFDTGLGRVDLLEIIAQVGSTTLVALTHNATGGIPLDPPLESQAWG